MLHIRLVPPFVITYRRSSAPAIATSVYLKLLYGEVGRDEQHALRRGAG
jgi:hypothetical protein